MAEINRRFYAKNKELATKAYADSSFTAARAYADTKKTEAVTESETYTDNALANYLAKNNTTAYTPSGAYNPATKMYVDSSVQGVETQYTTMPTADAGNVGKVIQYVGNTNPNYEKGYFYECVSDGEDPATYSWEELNVQEPGGQAEVMPEPSADNVGQIIQYTGEDSGELEQGHFYICKEEEVSGIINYYWEEINVQDTPPTVKKYEVTLTTDCLTDTGQGSRRLNEHDVTALSEFINWMGEQTEDVYLQINLANQPKAVSIYGDSYYNVGTFRFTYPFDSPSKILYGKTPFMVPIYAVGGIPTPYHDKTWGYFAIVFLHYEFIGSNYNNVSVSRDCFGYSAVASYGLTKDNRTSYTPTLDYHPATKKYVDDTVASAMSAAIKREIVQELPVSDIKTDTIYMVPKTEPGSQDTYDEYMYINSAWEKIGSTDIDLSDYVTTEEMEEYVEENATAQVTEMPEAGQENVGQIIQYVGESGSGYEQGYFYICKEEAGSGMPTYYWEAINVQPGTGNFEFFKGTENEWNALTQEQKANILFAAVLGDDFELTPAEEEDLTSSLGVDGDIEVDMSLEDALDAALNIANGN